MTTIKQATEAKAEVRANAKQQIDELQAKINLIKQERDQEIARLNAIIEGIRQERNGKIQANKAKREAKREAKAQAKEAMMAELRRKAYETAAKKAKEHMASVHPDKGGTNEGFRAAYAMWKDLEALAKQA